MAKNIKIIYSPEGGSQREWIFDLENPPWDITYATEKATDWPWGVFRARFMNESAIALRALLWVLRKRDEPKLQLDSVVPDPSELAYEGQCPDCGEWVSTDDDDPDAGHKCTSEAQDGGTGDEGDSDPEA
jgi:hypothetical protein